MKEEKKTGKEWVSLLGIVITNNLFKGFGNFEFFYNTPITKMEFLNRASQCTIEKSKDVLSRRDIAELKKKLKN